MTVSSATTAAVAPPLVPSSKKDEPSKFTISVETPYSKAFTTLTGRASPINKAEETTYKFLKEITEQSKYEKPDYNELNKLLDSLERLYLDKVPPILLEADKLASKEIKQFLNESKSYTNTLIKKSEKPVKSCSWIKMLGVSLLISSVVFGGIAYFRHNVLNVNQPTYFYYNNRIIPYANGSIPSNITFETQLEQEEASYNQWLKDNPIPSPTHELPDHVHSNTPIEITISFAGGRAAHTSSGIPLRAAQHDKEKLYAYFAAKDKRLEKLEKKREEIVNKQFANERILREQRIHQESPSSKQSWFW